MRLFEPYWPTIAILIVKDLQRRPQICQSVCDLLGMGVQDFLRLTQFHTIPYLILTRSRDILQRIANANGGNKDLVSICSESSQLAAILARLLLHLSPDPENMIMSLLSEVSPEFSKIGPQDIFRSDPTRIAFELLKVAAESEENTKLKAHQGITTLAERIERKSSKKYSAVALFFEESALGIIQLLSEIIGQTKGPRPSWERRRCIGAIQEMAVLAKSHLCNALPQVCTLNLQLGMY